MSQRLAMKKHRGMPATLNRKDQLKFLGASTVMTTVTRLATVQSHWNSPRLLSEGSDINKRKILPIVLVKSSLTSEFSWMILKIRMWRKTTPLFFNGSPPATSAWKRTAIPMETSIQQRLKPRKYCAFEMFTISRHLTFTRRHVLTLELSWQWPKVSKPNIILLPQVKA